MFPEGGPHDQSATTRTLAAATWNLREPSSAFSNHAPVRGQGWSASDVLDPRADVDGRVQEKVERSTGDILGGKARHWDAAERWTQNGTGLGKPSLPESLGCPSSIGKQLVPGCENGSEIDGNMLAMESSAHTPSNLRCSSCFEAGYRGPSSSSPTPEESDHDAENGPNSVAGMKEGCRITLESLPMSGASLKTAPLTSCETRVSARSTRTRFTFSPMSLAEDVVAALDEESPSPPSPTSPTPPTPPTSPSVDERGDYLTHDGEDGKHEGNKDNSRPEANEVTAPAVPTNDAGSCPGRRAGNVLDEPSDDRYNEDVAEYADSQHAFLREKELELASRSRYLDEPGRPGVLTAASRAALLDWLERLYTVAPTACRHAPKLAEEVLFLAANIVDRFLSIPEAGGKLLEGGYTLESAAASALSLAAKFEDAKAPSLWAFAAASKVVSGTASLGNLIASCNHTSGEGRPSGSRCACEVCETRRELVRAEDLVLSALGFRMMAPTALSFLNIYLERARRLGPLRSPEVEEKIRNEAIETLWDVVRDASSLDYRPSELAATALYLACCDASSSTPPPWLDLLAVTEIELEQLQGCLGNIRRVKASTPSHAEEVTPCDSMGGCNCCSTLERGDDETHRVEDGDYAGGGLGTLGADAECEIRGGAGQVAGMEVYAVETGGGLVESVPRLGGVGSGLGHAGDTSVHGGMEVSEQREGGDGGFLDRILILGGWETERGSGGDASRDGGVEVYDFEMAGGFVDRMLRPGAVDINRGPWGDAPTVGDLDVFEVEMGGGFVDSVLRVGGVETGDGPRVGGVPDVPAVEVYGDFADSVLRLGGVETSGGLGSGSSVGRDAGDSAGEASYAFAFHSTSLAGAESSDTLGGRAPRHGEGEIAPSDLGDTIVNRVSRLGGEERSDTVGVSNPEAHGVRPRGGFEDSDGDLMGSAERGASRGAPDSTQEHRSSTRGSNHLDNGGGFGCAYGDNLRR